jgi:hypothetical protein
MHTHDPNHEATRSYPKSVKEGASNVLHVIEAFLHIKEEGAKEKCHEKEQDASI